MPGSADNPVVLDPFRTIIEVGWNRATHVAFYIEVAVGFISNLFQDYPPMPEDRPLIPTSDWFTTWIQQINNMGSATNTVQYVNSGGPHSPYVYRENSGWSGVSESDVPIDGGMPPFTDSASWNAGTTLNNPSVGPVFEDLWKMTPGGSGAGLTVPGEPTIAFDSNATPHAYVSHNAHYTEAPYWADGPGLSIAYGAYTASLETVLIDKAYPAADMVVRYKGKAYRGCATAFDDPGGSLSKRLWILFQRSPSDD